MDVTVLGFGGAEIGYEEASDETVANLLNGALDAGLNVIDTAECYRDSEEMIGRAVSGRRDDFYLFTKCGHPHGGESAANWSRDSILQSIERSLKRLKTDKIDIVHLHSCSESELRKGEAIEALQTARERGHTRYIGYSGDSRAAHYAVECGAFDTLQTSINIADQEGDRFDGAAGARETNGRDRETSDRKRGLEDRAQTDRFLSARILGAVAKLNYDFLQHSDLETTISIALRFTLSVPGVHTAIVGTSKPERWKQNAKFLEEGPLKEEEISTRFGSAGKNTRRESGSDKYDQFFLARQLRE